MPNYRAMARRAARRHGLNPDIFERQIQQESGFAEDVITGRRRSSAGAQGIAQIMPATARGWGVDPLNPKQALNAAAKNMASYVRKYGGYENALRAYNAGPGAIERSKGFSETNHYVATILKGKDPGKLSKASRRGGGGGGRTPITLGSPGTAANVAALLAQEKQQRARAPVSAPTASALLATPSIMPEGYRPLQTSAPVQPSESESVLDKLGNLEDSIPKVSGGEPRRGGGGSRRGGGGGAPAKGSEIKELIWAGPGAQFIDNGKFVAPYAADAHRDHVHVAAGPKTVDRLGRLAQSMGLHVGENPDFGGVDPVHTGDSFHYRDMAIDVSGDPAKMRRFAKRVARYQRRRGR